MSLKDDNKFWNKFGADSQLANSEKGVNVQWTRPGTYKAYRPVKFDKGVDLPFLNQSLAEDYIESSTNMPLNGNRFIWEKWIEPDFNMTNGAVQGTSFGSRMGYFSATYAILDYISFYSLGQDFGNSIFFIRVSGNNFVYPITTGFTWIAGSLNHLMIVVDRDGIGATTDTVRLYLNGIKIYSDDTVPNNQTNTSAKLIFGAAANNDANDIQFQFDGGMDNPKINQYVSKITEENVTDVINNMNNEGFLGLILKGFNNGFNEGLN
jgi:hypothetical protein